jgi:hypothetical protein
MKKKILILALVLVGITGFSFAADRPNINRNVLVSFNREFVNAQDVKWVTNNNFLKASFSMNNMVLYAFYSSDGELLAVSRFISPDHLPFRLLTKLKKDYAGYWVSDLFEIDDDSGTAYYVTLENSNQKKVLTSLNNSGWATYKTENKGY